MIFTLIYKNTIMESNNRLIYLKLNSVIHASHILAAFRRMLFRTYEERKEAAEKITRESDMLERLFSRLKRSEDMVGLYQAAILFVKFEGLICATE